MPRGISLVITLLFASLTFAVNAVAASLTNETLVGKWVVNEGKCTDANAEFLIFQKNGAVESIRDGKLDALGFWTLSDDNIDVDVLAPPSFFKERFKELKDASVGYQQFHITIAAFDIAADSFQGIGVLGEQVRRGKFARCKS
jgi:hypothetical protein